MVRPAKLTKEQAAIISAYTGYLIGAFADLHNAIEKKLGRPVLTHELPGIENDIKAAFKEDFIALNPKESNAS